MTAGGEAWPARHSHKGDTVSVRGPGSDCVGQEGVRPVRAAAGRSGVPKMGRVRSGLTLGRPVPSVRGSRRGWRGGTWRWRRLGVASPPTSRAEKGISAQACGARDSAAAPPGSTPSPRGGELDDGLTRLMHPCGAEEWAGCALLGAEPRGSCGAACGLARPANPSVGVGLTAHRPYPASGSGVSKSGTHSLCA